MRDPERLRVTLDLIADGFSAEMDLPPLPPGAVRRIDRAIRHEKRRPAGFPLAFAPLGTGDFGDPDAGLFGFSSEEGK